MPLFRYIDCTIPLLPKSKISKLQPSSLTVQFVSDLVGNPEDRFSRYAAQIAFRDANCCVYL